MLVKSEDVRTDLLMLNCVRVMDLILQQELGEDLGLLTYNVLPTGPNTGIVEYVQNALTIAEIKDKFGSYVKYFEGKTHKQKERLETTRCNFSFFSLFHFHFSLCVMYCFHY